MPSIISATNTNGVAVIGDNSGDLQLRTQNGANVITVPNGTGNMVVNNVNSAIVSGTAVSASGTSVDFTGIPSWVRRITVMFNGVSTNGSSAVQVQLGSGSVTTTGYAGSSSLINGTNSCNWAPYTTGFGINMTSASAVRSGHLVVTNVSGNIWAGSGVVGDNVVATSFTAGNVTLSGTLDRVRITTTNGTDAFDAGTINILYE